MFIVVGPDVHMVNKCAYCGKQSRGYQWCCLKPNQYFVPATFTANDKLADNWRCPDSEYIGHLTLGQLIFTTVFATFLHRGRGKLNFRSGA